MALKNLTWRSLFSSSCFEPKSLNSRNQNSNQNATSRMSLSDISHLSNLHIFTVAEAKVITNDFSSSNCLGKDSFGTVYKGYVDDTCRPGLEAQPVAVKLLDWIGRLGPREQLTEVLFLGQLRHPNLVKVIGYCCEDEASFLVYEYTDSVSLENRLFTSSPPWFTRMKIAVGVAKGLAFLREEDKSVINCDLRASNILLDSDCNAKLSGFGLTREDLNPDYTQLNVRTTGYDAPEYYMTGRLTTMNDVYSFGVVLLELLTGKRAFDQNRPSTRFLAQWAKPYLKNHHNVHRLMDPRLERHYPAKGAKKVAALAHQCLDDVPKYRPNMTKVLEILEPLLESSAENRATCFGLC